MVLLEELLLLDEVETEEVEVEDISKIKDHKSVFKFTITVELVEILLELDELELEVDIDELDVDSELLLEL
jgi:hypothetical protein